MLNPASFTNYSNLSSIFNHPQFICPYCHSPLIPNAKTWQCDGSLNDKGIKHPFDVAKQGYVNLLPVQHKKSKDPGDSQESIEARHRFLTKGFYQPLQQKVSELVGSIETQTALQTSNWLDIGCGDGYYTQAIAQSQQSQHAPDSALIAVDISKPAVALLAKSAKGRQQLWYQVNATGDNTKKKTTVIYPLVASASKLPLTDNSVDGITSIFSPILPKEFARVLKVGGRLIIAKPDVGHLQSVREALFEEVRAHDSDKFLDELTPLFELKQTHHVQAELSLDLASLTDLLTMTPYSYRAKADKRESLLGQVEKGDFQTMAKFVVYELVRV